jgi:hypothetical protein
LRIQVNTVTMITDFNGIILVRMASTVDLAILHNYIFTII